MHPYVALATVTIRTYATKGNKPAVPKPLPEIMKARAGVFVSIKKHGELRGCIGSILPVSENIAEEIIDNAVSASAFDPRFPPVEQSELGELTVNVDVLSAPEPADDISALDARKYGVIVSSGRRRGLLLPDLEGVDSPEQQIEICRRKGGISPEEKVEIQRFTVARYK